MKNTRMAMIALALVAGLSTMAIAQRGGGGGGRGGRGGNSVPALLANIHVTQAQQAKIDTITKVYTDSTTAIRTADQAANGGGAAAGGAGGRGGRGGRGGATLSDSAQAKTDTLTVHRNAAIRVVLDKDQQKIFDKAVADADAARRGGGAGDLLRSDFFR